MVGLTSLNVLLSMSGPILSDVKFDGQIHVELGFVFKRTHTSGIDPFELVDP